MNDLDRLFSPARVVFVGASANPQKIGSRGALYMLRHGFSGEIWAVNPSGEGPSGVATVTGISGLPDGIDVAVLAISGDRIIESVAECGRKRIPFAIIFANGFADTGDFAAQDELRRVAVEGGVRLVGPNCLGVLDMHSGFAGTFSSLLARDQLTAGRIGLVSQSGAVGNSVLLSFQALGIGISRWMATGNEADIDALQALEYMLGREDTGVAVAVLEAVDRAGERLRRLGKASRDHRKPVLVFKAGKSDASKRAAQSHTGKIVGSHEAWSQVIDGCGLLNIESLEHLSDAAGAFDTFDWNGEGTAAILCGSGGMGGIICDDLTAAGIGLSTLNAGTTADLKSILPGGASVLNPVDPTTVSEDVYFQTADTILQDADVSLLILALNSLARDYRTLSRRLKDLLARAKRLHKAVAITYFSPFDTLPAAEEHELAAEGLLIMPTSGRLARALGTVAKWHAISTSPDPARPGVDQSATSVIKADQTVAALPQLASLLGSYDIGVVPTKEVRSSDDALSVRLRRDGAIVLKLEASELPHKSDNGLVRLGLRDSAMVEGAFAELSELQKRHGGVIIAQPQIEDALEVIVGGVLDPELGWLVTVGLGGVFVELLGEVRAMACPVDVREAAEILGQGRLGRMMAGYRGQSGRDRAALAHVVARVSQLLVDQPGMTEFELNPVLIGAEGEGALAVDALATFAPQAGCCDLRDA